MGRETVTTAEWRGARAEVRALLESQEIILRGAIRARIPRSDVNAVTVSGDELRVMAGDEPLVLALGASEAASWASALRKPPPSLAEKLGVSTAKPAYVWGSPDDQSLREALVGAVTDKPTDASVIVAVIADEADLDAIFALARSAPNLPLWCVYPKGRGGPDAVIRDYLRSRGYVDTKTSAVSDRLTAMRYKRRDRTG
ncbi:MAG TPA: hypothetical protein VF444_07125 [Pseudonocardiaceae bacterium]